MKQKKQASDIELLQLRGAANYLFSCNVGEYIFPNNIEIVCSKSNKPKHVFLKNTLIATIRPHDGYIILSKFGFTLLLKNLKIFKCLKRILVRSDIVPYLQEYKTLFAKHIVDCSADIRPHEEILLCDKSGKPVGMAHTLLSALEMKHFNYGAAAKIRYILLENKIF